MRSRSIYLKLIFSLVTFFSVAAVAESNSGESGVLLRHGNVIVTVEDVELYVRSRVPAENVADAIGRDGMVLRIIENIHTLRALADQADSLGLDMELLNWEAELNKARLFSDAVAQKHVEIAFSKIDWESAAHEEYIANPADYIVSERAAASHILIGTLNRSDAEAKQLAEDLRNRVLKGEKFSVLVTEFSDDPSSADNRGRLGTFGRGKMVPEFEKALFALREDGALAEVTKTQYGYHVIQLNKYYPAGKQSFKQAKKKIIESLKSRMAKDIREAETGKIRNVSSSDIVADEQAINELQAKFKSAAEK